MQERLQLVDGESQGKLAALSKLRDSVSTLKEACAKLQSENHELKSQMEKGKVALTFAEEEVRAKDEQLKQLSEELQQVTYFVMFYILISRVYSSRSPPRDVLVTFTAS